MSRLLLLKSAENLSDLAKLLGVSPMVLGFALHELDHSKKYTEFEIPKRSGGTRRINAPHPLLKAVQRQLHDLLAHCVSEIEQASNLQHAHKLSHGFHPKRSIITNAVRHRNKRWVFNIDLKDFFPSINFGRVRGYFLKNRYFGLRPKVATVIAQIACHNNELPQGAPTSPIISNLVASILDMRLARFARKNGCSYSRYADDITFSTNRRDFPKALASCPDEKAGLWEPGYQLLQIIGRSGFQINDRKTRMQYERSRQDVTGLIVNEKINVKREYYKQVRAYCDRLFKTGACRRSLGEGAGKQGERLTLNQLEGMLAFIFQVKGCEHDHKRTRGDIKAPRPSYYRLYREFLDFKHFAAADKPVLLCEGETDQTYVECAIRSLKAEFPSLIGGDKENKFKFRFFRYTHNSNAIQLLRGGTGNIKEFINDYEFRMKKFAAAKFLHPVIILVDNDAGSKGPKGIFQKIENLSQENYKFDGSETFHHVCRNLYILPLPLPDGKQDSMIEDFLPQSILDVRLREKTFYPSDNGFDRKRHFGKKALSRFVRRQQNSVDFSGYKPVLKAMEEIISDYDKRKAVHRAAPAGQS
jgi:RNA-directed DNA polymerase